MSAPFHTYVVELSPEAAHRHKSKDRLLRGGKCYYVGSTHIDPQQRLAVHLSGRRVGSGIVAHFGRRIVKTKGYATREAAERAEHALAVRLSKRGNVVYTG